MASPDRHVRQPKSNVAELRKCLSNVHANPKGRHDEFWRALTAYHTPLAGQTNPISFIIHFNVDSAARNVHTHVSDISLLEKVSWSSDTTPKDVQVADHSWQWTKFADKQVTRECHGYFEMSGESPELTSESLRLFSSFLHFGATCTSFPVSLGKDHWVFIKGDPTQYVVQYFRVANAEDDQIFCVVKEPYRALYYKLPQYSVSWKVYDDAARIFKLLSTDQQLDRELTASHYAAMSSSSIFSHSYLPRLSKLLKQQYLMRYTRCDDEDGYRGIAMDLVRFPTSKVSSVVRFVNHSQRDLEHWPVGVTAGARVAFQSNVEIWRSSVWQICDGIARYYQSRGCAYDALFSKYCEDSYVIRYTQLCI